MRRVVAAVALAASLSAGCSGDDVTAGSAGTADAAAGETTGPNQAPVADPHLRDELLAMMAEDQEARTGGSATGSDEARTERLRAIIEEDGWPTFDLVGVDGSTAAWVIAQHADFDPAFQEEVARLLRPLVEQGQADASELAYLEDRIAVNAGREQRYGTQIRCRDGVPSPATPIVDEATVDSRREAVGLEPLADYYADLGEACATEG